MAGVRAVEPLPAPASAESRPPVDTACLQSVGHGVKKVLRAETTHIAMELAVGAGLLGGTRGVHGTELGVEVARGAMYWGGGSSLLLGLVTALSKFSRQYARRQGQEAFALLGCIRARQQACIDCRASYSDLMPEQPEPL